MNDLAPLEVLRASDLDGLRGNIEYLLSPNRQVVRRIQGSAYSSSSTVWVNIDTTNLSLTLQTSGGPVLCVVQLMIGTLGTGNWVYFDITVDGLRQSGCDYGLAAGQTNGSISLHLLVDSLSAGSHTFRLQWRGLNANGQQVQSSSNTYPVIFAAIEL